MPDTDWEAYAEKMRPLEAKSLGINGEWLMSLMHGVMGISGEAGELVDAVKKHVFYDQPLDHLNILEEIGDILWYVRVLCDTLGVDLQEVLDANCRKLEARYGDKFDSERCANRDVAAEREAMK